MDRQDHSRQRKDEHGYAMAVLLVGIAILMVLLSMAMPVWNQQAKREREEELLFRLKQYAHAIALYQRRMPGAQPPSLDVLVEQRFLRKKYKDPITGGDFAILRAGQLSVGMTTALPGMTVPTPGSTPPGSSIGWGGAGGQGGLPGSGAGPSGRDQSGRGPQSGPGQRGPGTSASGVGSQQSVGAIRGVVSKSPDTSLRSWKGRTRYDQWEVTPEDIVPRFGSTTPQSPAGQGGPGSPSPGTSRPQGGGGGAQPSGRPSSPFGTPRR